MNEVTKENIKEFLTFYHAFHDAIIKNVNFNIIGDSVEIILHIIWAGDTELDEDNKFKTVDKNIKLIFSDINDLSIKHFDQFNYISEVYLKFINYKSEECICFADELNKPTIYVVSNKLSYEEI